MVKRDGLVDKLVVRAEGTGQVSHAGSALVAGVADRIGVEHVALGSDFDGASIPASLGDVAGMPRVLDALREIGFSEGELDAIAWGNWRRVLAAWWST